MLACLANALGVTYEDVEQLLNVDGGNLPEGGVDIKMAIGRLLQRGWTAVPLIAGDGTDPMWPTVVEIKAQLPGRIAILGYNDAEAGPHALYWDGGELHDCSEPPPAHPPQLSSLKLEHALILFPVTPVAGCAQVP